MVCKWCFTDYSLSTKLSTSLNSIKLTKTETFKYMSYNPLYKFNIWPIIISFMIKCWSRFLSLFVSLYLNLFPLLGQKLYENNYVHTFILCLTKYLVLKASWLCLRADTDANTPNIKYNTSGKQCNIYNALELQELLN